MREYSIYIYRFLIAMLLALVHFFVTKLIFIVKYGSNIAFFDWVYNSLRFDISAIFYAYSPFILLSLLPILYLQRQHYYRSLIKLLFIISTFFTLLVNCLDIEYVNYTNRRLTYDFIQFMNTGNDFKLQVPKILLNYWYYILMFIFLMLIVSYCFNKWSNRVVPVFHNPIKFKDQLTPVFAYILLIGFCFLGARGGTQLRPIGIMDASKYVAPSETKFILNSCFTFIRSYGKEELIKFNEQSSSNVIKNYESSLFTAQTKFKPKNVVLIIIESLSSSYSGFLSHTEETYTHFLDSLMQHSLVFENCLSNGRRSIDGVPAVISGLPTLMNTPIVSSTYAQNNLSSIASLLKRKGYFSAFFHGGINGTMGFDSFVNSIGYDKYYGKNEYPHKDDYDGYWGIYDHAFLNFTLEEINQFDQPFFSTFFSLSTHHPYKLPKEYKNKFEGKAGNEMLKMVQYIDFALQQFFTNASKEPWFDNTVFVFTADHCPPTSLSLKKRKYWRDYQIPFFIYDPSSSNSELNKLITQQIDIQPTLLGYLNYDLPYLKFGNNMLGEPNWTFSVTYTNNSYQFITERAIYWYSLDGENLNLQRVENLFGKKFEGNIYNLDTINAKSYIHSYNNRMINNKLVLIDE